MDYLRWVWRAKKIKETDSGPVEFRPKSNYVKATKKKIYTSVNQVQPEGKYRKKVNSYIVM